jgi:hypothetical protein
MLANRDLYIAFDGDSSIFVASIVHFSFVERTPVFWCASMASMKGESMIHICPAKIAKR